MMDDFKKASTLHDEYKREPSPPPRGRTTSTSFKSKTSKCEHHDQGVCKASREAVRLGLRKKAIICTGNIPPSCVIQQALASGKTIQEILQK